MAGAVADTALMVPLSRSRTPFGSRFYDLELASTQESSRVALTVALHLSERNGCFFLLGPSFPSYRKKIAQFGGRHGRTSLFELAKGRGSIVGDCKYANVGLFRRRRSTRKNATSSSRAFATRSTRSTSSLRKCLNICVFVSRTHCKSPRQHGRHV